MIGGVQGPSGVNSFPADLTKGELVKEIKDQLTEQGHEVTNAINNGAPLKDICDILVKNTNLINGKIDELGRAGISTQTIDQIKSDVSALEDTCFDGVSDLPSSLSLYGPTIDAYQTRISNSLDDFNGSKTNSYTPIDRTSV